MIIRPDEPALDIDDFMEGLRDAARAVVLVRWGTTSSASTGWCITGNLVVTPPFGIRGEDQRAHCVSPLSPEPLEVSAMEIIKVDGNELDLAILRLARPLEHAVTLALDATRPLEPVSLLHYPLGTPRAKISTGRVEGAEDARILHSANTEPGSSGGPLFNARWRMIAMHTAANIERRVNTAHAVSSMLEVLQRSTSWPEIAEHHKVAARSSTRPTRVPPITDAAPDLLSIAVRWWIDPAALAPDVLEAARALVVDKEAPRWTLRPSERMRILRGAPSIEALRKARGDAAINDPNQAVIDRILKGPPFDLAEVETAVLPHWLQAARWFAGVVSGLPSVAEIHRLLARRRVRGKLQDIAGPSFRGRAEDLAAMAAWYAQSDAGPLAIWGVGGIGKSALVARFAETLDGEPVLLWLDFDRVDLAPDDAVSILSALGEQCAAQLDGFEKYPTSPETWQTDARALGTVLAQAQRGRPAPLLVMDSFEVAQHADRHQEIWGVLEQILATMPRMRVIVTGRAPVGDLKLAGRAAVPMRLGGLRREDADAWLLEKNILDDALRAKVLDTAGGVPLVLKLAVRLVEAGGAAALSKEDLPKQLIEGFLYQRILDRVMDGALRPLARGVLVLRRMTAPMLEEVLPAWLPEGSDAAATFERLRKEMALVEGEAVLRVRPEVRAATLRLLEHEDAAFVREIDARAEAWYAKNAEDDAALVAELVYHRLRLGDVSGAASAWRAGCEIHLKYAEDELESAPRSWLKAKLGIGPVIQMDPATWEQEAARRIRDAGARGLTRAMPEILGERAERTSDSPLVFYDAWTRLDAGDLASAREILKRAKEGSSETERQRSVLRALVEARDGRREEADRFLVRALQLTESGWAETPDGTLEVAALGAARLRLTVRLSAEDGLLEHIEQHPKENVAASLGAALTPLDVHLLDLQRHLLSAWSSSFESFATTNVEIGRPNPGSLRDEFLPQVASSPFRLAVQRRLAQRENSDAPYAPRPVELPLDELLADLTPQERESVKLVPQSALELAIDAGRRWEIATQTRALFDIDRLASTKTLSSSALAATVLCSPISLCNAWGFGLTLSFFRRSARRESFLEWCEDLLVRVAGARSSARLLERSTASLPQFTLVERILARDRGAPDFLAGMLRNGGAPLPEVAGAALKLWPPRDSSWHLAFYVLLPDPLDLLVRRLAGLGDPS